MNSVVLSTEPWTPARRASQLTRSIVFTWQDLQWRGLSEAST